MPLPKPSEDGPRRFQAQRWEQLACRLAEGSGVMGGSGRLHILTGWFPTASFSVLLFSPVFVKLNEESQGTRAFKSSAGDFIEVLTWIITRFVPSISSTVFQLGLSAWFKKKERNLHFLLIPCLALLCMGWRWQCSASGSAWWDAGGEGRWAEGSGTPPSLHSQRVAENESSVLHPTLGLLLPWVGKC